MFVVLSPIPFGEFVTKYYNRIISLTANLYNGKTIFLFSCVIGGWGWLVCGAAFLAHLLTSGVQLAFGLLYLYTMKFLVKKNQEREFYAMATGKLIISSLGKFCLF